MTGISSKALGAGGNDPSCGCPNKKGFNGNEIQQKEFNDGSGLEVYDFNARTYDQQIGRFIQIDPLTEEGGQEILSPYQFSYNNPVRFNDPDGRCPTCWGYLLEGFRQIFQAAGNLVSFKAEVHVNKEVEVKQEVKTPAGTVENKTTTTVVENKAQIETKFGDFFKNKGGKLMDVSVGSSTMTKVENETSGTVNTNGVPVKVSSKTTVDKNGTRQTTSAGTEVKVETGVAKVKVGAEGFVAQQKTGNNAGQAYYGLRLYADATLVSKKVNVISTPVLKVSTTTQTSFGGSFVKQYNLPWQW